MTVGNLIRSLVPQRLHNVLFRMSCPRVGDDLRQSYAAGMSMWWSLENLKRCGFYPANVIDVGAFVGEFTQRTRAIWPNAKYLMIEPQPNKQERLRVLCNDRVSLERALLGSAPAEEVPFHMDDLGNSSVFETVQNERLVADAFPMKTLDSVVFSRNMTGPILIKEDVQGYELEVLRGANETLRKTEVILLEVSTLPYNIGAPLFSDVVAFMADRKFLMYDVCQFHRRDCDLVIYQMDVLFVREDSALRAEKPFFGVLRSDWPVQNAS
jgi:FkbM family methyltransferase